MSALTEKMFYQIDENGNAVIFHESGEQVTRIDANIYPIDSDLSAKYEHANGIILSVDDANGLGIEFVE